MVRSHHRLLLSCTLSNHANATWYTDLNLYVGQLTERQKSDPAVRHALSVQRAVAMGNYHALFDLYLNAPNMGAYIMDHFIDRERIRALMVMTKA